MKKIFKMSLFSPKFRINKIRNLSSLRELNSEDGFTLVELIVVVMMIGVLSSIAIPQFMTAADKAKQKEATGIVSALIKAATAYQTEYGSLPETHLDISEFAKFQKCSADDAADEGGAVCKNARPAALDDDEFRFISPSGHYDIWFRVDGDGADQEFQVLANPNGTAYSGNGSAVTGCYAPQAALTEVYEFTAKAREQEDGKGIRGWRACQQ
tara:strand:- start:96 stop:731 length:636 start_codon:yes stop_codon:yes gene_type:complete